MDVWILRIHMRSDDLTCIWILGHLWWGRRWWERIPWSLLDSLPGFLIHEEGIEPQNWGWKNVPCCYSKGSLTSPPCVPRCANVDNVSSTSSVKVKCSFVKLLFLWILLQFSNSVTIPVLYGKIAQRSPHCRCGDFYKLQVSSKSLWVVVAKREWTQKT